MSYLDFKRKNQNRMYFYGIDLKEPSEKEFKKYIDIWNNKYNREFVAGFDHEKLLNIVFEDYNHSNKNVKDMYIKCVMLDKLYSTNIKYMDSLVKHLVSIENLDEMLSNGDAELVNIIKKVQVDDDKTINYMSFASKYCNRYNPEYYPVYDTIVKEIFSYYLSTLSFYKRKDKVELKDYASFKNVVDEFLKAYPFIKNYTQLDNYLWTMGKEKLQGINLVKKVRKNENDIKKLQAIAKELNYQGELTAEQLEEFIVKQYDLV